MFTVGGHGVVRQPGSTHFDIVLPSREETKELFSDMLAAESRAEASPLTRPLKIDGSVQGEREVGARRQRQSSGLDQAVIA